MLILLLCAFAALFIYFGYYIMAKLDKFLEEKMHMVEHDKAHPIAILFGKTELANQIDAILKINQINIIRITEPFLIEYNKNVQYLFALSENDADNIVLYKIGSKIYGIEKIISICNDNRNESMFISEKISYLIGKGITAQMIYAAVLQRKEENYEKT